MQKAWLSMDGHGAEGQWLDSFTTKDCIWSSVDAGVYEDLLPQGRVSMNINKNKKNVKVDQDNFALKGILNHLIMEYWKITFAIFSSRQRVFPSELLKLPL